MAHRATASSGQKETETAAFASLTAADIIRAPIVQRRIPVDFRPLLKPFKSAGRLCLRIERLPQGAKLSAGRRSTDNSWSLASDELEDLEYLVSSNVSPDHELTVRVMTFEDGAASTLKVVQFAMPAPPGDTEPVQTGRDPHAQDAVTRSQLSEMHSLFAVRESELVELRAALQRAASEKESELAKARGEWELELDRKIAEAVAKSGLQDKLNGEAKEADRKGKAAREQQQAEQRISAEREKAKAEAERRIESARQQWQADAGRNLEVARQVWQKDAEERQRAEINALIADAERRIQAQAEEKAAKERKRWSVDANRQIEEARLAWQAEDDERRREDLEKWNADVDQRIEDERRKWLAEGGKHDRAEFERSKAEIESRIRSERQNWQIEADEQARKDRDGWQADAEQRIEAVRRTCQADADTKLAAELARQQAEAEKRIEAVWRACQTDADTKLAVELARQQAEAEKRIEAVRRTCQTDADTKLAAELARLQAEAERRIETEKQTFESEMRAAASAVERLSLRQDPGIDHEGVHELATEKEKNAQLNAALAAEADRCREAETALAAMTLRCENAERAQTTGEVRAPAGESDDGYIRGLRAEIATLRKSLANQAAELARARASLEQSRPMHIQRGPENKPLGNLRDVLLDDEEELVQDRKKGVVRDCLMVAAVVVPLILCWSWIAAYLPQPVRSSIGVATGGLLSVEEEKPVVPQASPKKAVPAPQVSRPTATASRVLNVHASPGSKGEVLFSLPKNTVVELLETQGNWTRVEAPADGAAKARQGWVYSSYLHDNDN